MESTLKIDNLNPNDSHVSFYGKAKVIRDNFGTYYLQSYETIVAVYVDAPGNPDNGFHRLWSGWSATTGRHISAFCSYVGCAQVNKKQWDKMPVEHWNTDGLLQPFNWNRVTGSAYYGWY